METDNFRKFGEELYREYISAKQIGIPSIKITYWKKYNVLPFFKKKHKQKHAKLDVTQALWLLIVNELSEIGVSTEKLAQLSKDVFHKPRTEQFADHQIKENIEDEKIALSEKDKQNLKDILNDKLLMGTLRTELNPYTNAIKSCLWFEKRIPHSLIYVSKTGEHVFVNHDIELNLKLTTNYLERALINVPLNPLLAKIVDVDFDTKNKDLLYFTKLENQIRDTIIFKKPKHIEIVMDDGKVEPLIITEQHKTGEELAKFFLNNSLPKDAKLLIDVRNQGNYKITLIKKK